jgi:FKBP-type peptidyl-prolyl cis-trans isomerase
LIALCLVSAAAWVIAQEALPGGAPGAPPAGAPAAGPGVIPLDSAPPTDARHYSYAIGLQVGQSFHDDGVEIDADSLLAGLKDGLSGAKPKFDKELLDVAIERMYKLQEAKAKEKADKMRKEGAEFLAKNAKAQGVVVLPSGLQYKVIAKGAGATPKATDMVKAKYRGTFIDGKVFDESGDDAVEFPVNQVIAGWTEALQLMHVGDKWQLFIPGNLAYPEGRDEIPPGVPLLFDNELVDVSPAAPGAGRFAPPR